MKKGDHVATLFLNCNEQIPPWDIGAPFLNDLPAFLEISESQGAVIAMEGRILKADDKSVPFI